MARGVNKVILIGNLGKDPEVRYTFNNKAICNVVLATTESRKDKETNERYERTEWHRLVFFGRLAEIAKQWLRKGSQVYIEGRLQTRKWQDQAGNERHTTEIVVSEMNRLGSQGGSHYSHEHKDDHSHKQFTDDDGNVADNNHGNFKDDIIF